MNKGNQLFGSEQADVTDLLPSPWRFRKWWETFDSFRFWTHGYRYGLNKIKITAVFRIPNNEHHLSKLGNHILENLITLKWDWTLVFTFAKSHLSRRITVNEYDFKRRYNFSSQRHEIKYSFFSKWWYSLNIITLVKGVPFKSPPPLFMFDLGLSNQNGLRSRI